MDLQHLLQWTNGILLHKGSEEQIKELCIDSRKLINPSQALFIALKTTIRDGHSYIKDAYLKGVRFFLVSEKAINFSDYSNANFIYVSNTLRALQTMTAAYRQQFNLPVIGITGSNGKTIVKEWLFQLLNTQYDIVRSPKSYNSQIGVPLSVWLLRETANLGIFEAGISQKDEMQALEEMIKPEIGIFTNIGEAHNEGFADDEEKIREKLKLFAHSRLLIYNKDYGLLHSEIEALRQRRLSSNPAKPLELVSWSFEHSADLNITEKEIQGKKTVLKALYHNEALEIEIPYTDPAYIENAVHCWCTLLVLGLDKNHIAEQMKRLQPVAMRLELLHGMKNCTIINDSYNSDLTSLFIALDFLGQQQQHQVRTVILSDLLQTGNNEAFIYEQVAEALEQKRITRFIGIGEKIKKYDQLFSRQTAIDCYFYNNTEEFIKEVPSFVFSNEVILIKGARNFSFEKISALLQQEIHHTVLSVNLTALQHNVNVYRSRLKPDVKMMAMVKAFSYGSGSYEIANTLQYAGIDYLTVAYTDEGVTLRQTGITLPIMIMSPDIESFERIVAWKLEPEIYSFRSLEAFIQFAKERNITAYPVHLKLDTGMHRLGFEKQRLEELITILRAAPQIQIKSIFSHLVASEDPEMDSYTGVQASNFDTMCQQLKTELNIQPLLHLCNTAGIVRHPELHYDMVRLGLGLYGIDGTQALGKKLVQVASLKTTITQIKHIKAGETVGYNRRGIADKDSTIATISIGYADGYPRALSNGKGYVMIKGRKAPIIGVVCMDMCMVDVSAIPDVHEGDEVLVFGPELSISQVAAWAGTIPYEIMTGISQRVRRVYINES